MSPKNSGNQMACIDYQAPSGGRTDYRTSAYMGHRYIPDPVHISRVPTINRNSICNVLSRKEMAYDFTSEQKSSFTNKFVENSTERIPNLMANSIRYIKPYDEYFFSSAPRQINQYESRYCKDYVPKTLPDEEVKLEWKCPPKVKKSEVVINAALPGYSKYLDMMATTNMLTYVQHIPESAAAMSSKDTITLWNWLELTELKGGIKRIIPENLSGKEEPLCQDLPSQDCPKRREFQTRLKHVPNRGLTTETRKNYVRPEHKVDFHFDNVKCPIQFTTRVSLQKPSTEAQIYGSKHRIQKYVDVGGLEKKYVN